MSYTAYTDGGSSPNPGAGGWGVYWVVDDDIQNGEEFYGSEQHTTNNKMELTAVIQALRILEDKGGNKLQIVLDSEYVMKNFNDRLDDWIARDWRLASGEPVKNKELWEELCERAKKVDIIWKWTKGHAGDFGNEKADELVGKGREEASQ